MVDRFGMIDPASGHEPLYFGKANDVENYAIAGEQYVRLSDYEALRARLETVEADRAAQAERIKELERQLRGCTWYWPEDDTSSETCTESAQEVVQNAYDYKTPEGEVVAVARGGVVAVSYCAYLPPADDSDSDDDFWIEENTREAAKAKIDAELSRRAALGGNADAWAWPDGCIKPGSCERNKACMYVGCPNQDRDIANEVDAAVARAKEQETRG